MPRAKSASRKQLDKLWAPWRRKFLTHRKNRGCIFCDKPKEPDEAKVLLLERGRKVYSMLNLYPYNNGHLMIAPYRHCGDLTRLTRAESSEMFEMLRRILRKLRARLKPHGFNVGFNLGRAGGAGYDRHVHLHVVPRWIGDTNFMPVVSGTKVISESLEALRERLLQ